ncbi:MAG: T9SS type A sorting domain-containing protein [Runella sp.]
MKIKTPLSTYGLLAGFLLDISSVVAQNCSTLLTWTPTQRINLIEWDKFPAFSLPFTIVYEGPRFGDTQSRPLRHGFSHLATFSGSESSTLPVAKRAITWYHVATDANTQPWAERNLESPWANDLELYRRTWRNQLAGYANFFDESRGKGVPNYDLISLDIERIHDTDREILGIKNNPRVPAAYRALSDAQFVERYKRDMQKLYASPINFMRGIVPATTKVGSYSDVMVRGSFNNWLGMSIIPWKDWSTNLNYVLHVMRDTLTGKVGGTFYNQLNFLTPSCYYYYNYDTSPLGKDYLAYLLFVIEANRAWSDKPIIPYVWLRYHDAFNPNIPFVPPFVAEATAIFPFFSGAKGLWLWEGPVENTRQDNYAVYEHFIAGLYRLSQFKSFFEGTHELVIPQPAVEYAKSKTPIWRGVVKDKEILIAAQNPYATSDQQTIPLTLRYRNWQQTITLTGREVFLCKFDLGDVAAMVPVSPFKLTVAPNPVQKQIAFSFESPTTSDGEISVVDLTGKVIVKETFEPTLGIQNRALSVADAPVGMYVLRLRLGDEVETQRVIVTKF